jgi:hypothetical protein
MTKLKKSLNQPILNPKKFLHHLVVEENLAGDEEGAPQFAPLLSRIPPKMSSSRQNLLVAVVELPLNATSQPSIPTPKSFPHPQNVKQVVSAQFRKFLPPPTTAPRTSSKTPNLPFPISMNPP